MSTGIIYDERMCLHKEKDHPEKPDRIRSIFKKITDENLLPKCKWLLARDATPEELLTVHTEDHLNLVEKIPNIHSVSLKSLQNCFNSIYLNKYTACCAKLSAGGVIELCSQVVTGKLANGIAVVRPPGHHAEHNLPMGFCFYNNVAVAAKTMIERFHLNRIAILDWDVHHGNGTQHMFYQDPRVLYISIHRYDNGKFYPYHRDAEPSMVGSGAGIGRNVNIAWNTNLYTRPGNAEYLYAFNTLVKPMLSEYDPELIIVSAGFDCVEGDPLGGLKVTPNLFNHLTSELMNFSHGKVVIALEGGYNIEAIAHSMVACLKALLKEPKIEVTTHNSILSIAKDAVTETIKAHQPFWNFLRQSI